MDKESLYHEIYAIWHLQIQSRNCNNTATSFFWVAGSFTNVVFCGMTLAPFYSEHASHRFLQNTDTIYQTKPNQTIPNQTKQTIQITYQKTTM